MEFVEISSTMKMQVIVTTSDKVLMPSYNRHIEYEPSVNHVMASFERLLTNKFWNCFINHTVLSERRSLAFIQLSKQLNIHKRSNACMYLWRQHCLAERFITFAVQSTPKSTFATLWTIVVGGKNFSDRRSWEINNNYGPSCLKIISGISKVYHER